MFSEEFVRAVCHADDATSPWQPLTKRHEKFLEDLKEIIFDYVYEKCGSKVQRECIVPIIVAVYGSGKTTLMVTLCKWAWFQGIPAARVHLSKLYEYLLNIMRNENKSSISEDELSSYIDKFLIDYLRRKGYNADIKKGVLLVDEVEERYEEFTKILLGRNILRGLADDIRTGKSKALTIFAFAPSSAIEEVFSVGATAWRVTPFVIPSMTPSVIEDLFIEPRIAEVKVSSEDHRKILSALISNTIWWLSKGGKPGWVNSVVKAGVVDAILESLQYLIKKEDIAKMKICFEPPQDKILSDKVRETLRKEVVSGIPLFNYGEYELREKMAQNSINYNLVKVLPCFVGPVPESLLRELNCVRPGYTVPEELVVALNELINVRDLIDKFIEYAESSEFVSVERKQKAIEKLREVLEEVLTPWSLNGKLIYDVDSLIVLLSDFLQLKLLEYSERDLYAIVTNINVKRVVEEVRGNIIKTNTYYYALKSPVLLSLYLPTILQPLIACARGRKIESILSNLQSNVYILRDVLENDPLFRGFKQGTSERKGISIYLVLKKSDVDGIVDYIEDEVLHNKRLVAIILLSSLKGLKDYPTKEEVINKISTSIGKGLIDRFVYIVELPSVLAQYFLGRLYVKLYCKNELQKLSLAEKVIDDQGQRQLTKILKDINQAYNSFIAQQLNSLISRINNIKIPSASLNSFDALETNAHSYVGQEHGTYIWMLSVSDNVITILKSVIDKLQILSTFEDLMKYYGQSMKLRQDIALLLDKGDKYIDASQRLFKMLSRELDSSFEPLLGLIESLLKLVAKDSNVQGAFELISRLKSVWYETLALPSISKPALWIIASMILQDYIDKRRDFRISVKEPKEALYSLSESLKGIVRSINELHDAWKNLEDLLKSIDGAKIESIQTLINELNGINERVRKTIDGIEKLVSEHLDVLSSYEKTILYEYMQKILRRSGATSLLDRLDQVRQGLANTALTIEDIRKLITDIIKVCDELRNKFEVLYQACIEDLQQMIKDFLNSLSDVVSKSVQEGKSIITVLDDLKSEVERYRKTLDDILAHYESELKKLGELVGVIKELFELF